jgi:hypothetical protein
MISNIFLQYPIENEHREIKELLEKTFNVFFIIH